MTPDAAMSGGWAPVLSAWAAILGAVAWPFLAAAAGWWFRREIGDLLDRIREGAGFKFGRGPQDESPLRDSSATTGAATDPSPARAECAAQGGASIATPARIRTPASLELEASIRKLIPLESIADRAEREDTLIALLARMALYNEFFVVELLIWGSQLVVLGRLAAQERETQDTLKRFFYEPAKERYPALFTNYSFDAYLGFLVRNNLVRVLDDQVEIAPRGREYLLWRAEAGRPNLVPG